jgi:hypothetical protein
VPQEAQLFMMAIKPRAVVVIRTRNLDLKITLMLRRFKQNLFALTPRLPLIKPQRGTKDRPILPRPW